MPTLTTARTAPWLVLGLLLGVLATAGAFLFDLVETSRRLPPDRQPRLVLGDRLLDLPPVLTGGDVLVPAALVEELGGRLVDQDGLAVISSPRGLLQADLQASAARLDLEELDIPVPDHRVDGRLYVSAALVERLFPVSIHREGPAVVVDSLAEPVLEAEVMEAAPVRAEPRRTAPIAADARPGDTVRVFAEEDGGWLRVRAGGVLGYMDKRQVRLLPPRAPQAAGESARVPRHDLPGWSLLKPVNLTWVQETRARSGEPEGSPPPGVNVLSPTWFEIEADGSVRSIANPAFVHWAHAHGRYVWALVSNGFDPDRTSRFLNDPTARLRAARQLVALAALYRLDGINLDFENMHLADRDAYAAFVEELAGLARAQGLVTSVDVTLYSSSPNWSLVYDRAALGRAADYVIVMAYDQHTGSSGPGSVSEVAWVEDGIRRMLEEVPAHKLVLGIPFYVRVWDVTQDGEGRPDVRSRAVSMGRGLALAREAGVEPVWDEEAGQLYAGWQQAPGSWRHVWLEDERSLALRLDVVRRYRLAGVASWRLGLEEPEAWSVIDRHLQAGGY